MLENVHRVIKKHIKDNFVENAKFCLYPFLLAIVYIEMFVYKRKEIIYKKSVNMQDVTY